MEENILIHMKERQSSRSQSRPLVLKDQVEPKELLLLSEQIEKKKSWSLEESRKFSCMYVF